MAKVSLGKLMGSFMGVVWCSSLFLGFVECGLHISGLYGASQAYAARRLGGDGDHDHEDFDHINKERLVVDIIIRVVLLCAVCVFQLGGLLLHWVMYIKPTPKKYIPEHAVVPGDLKGKFKHSMFDCFRDTGTFCCFIWCPACMLSDYWFRSGWLHATMGDEGIACEGWQWVVGAFGVECGLQATGCFQPCILAALRGGIDGSDLGEIVPFRKRFGIKHEGLKTFISDCCAWCFCGPCAGTQEYRQVMDLLNRGPVRVAAPSVGPMLVGSAVQTGVAPIVVPCKVVGNTE